MAFEQVKCPECGEIVTVDSEKQNWRCSRCGKTFDISRAGAAFTGSANDFDIRNGVLWKYHGNETDVIIPDSVSVIGDYAFENRSDILSITFPQKLNSIGMYSFLGCTSLRMVDIPMIGFTDNNSISGMAEYLMSMAKLHFCIGRGAFGGCTGLISVEINARVNLDKERYISIAKSAFSDCTSLSHIAIGKSVTKIQSGAFDNCDENVSFVWPYLHMYPDCSNIVKKRADEKRCIYCGGEYKGLFTKKCRNCGRNRIS